MNAYIGFIIMFSVIYLHVGILLWLFFVPKKDNIHDLIRAMLWAFVWPYAVYYASRDKKEK